MTRLVILGFGLFGTLGWAVPALAQTTVKLQQGTNGYAGAMDTYIDKFVDDFYGGVERIEIRDWAGGASEKMNVLILFDVSSIPTNATVTSAKLTLYNIRARGHNANDVVVLEKVTSAWNNQSRWNTMPTVVASTVTCPPVTNPPYEEDPATPPPASQAYVITGMQSLVQGWMATPALNYGIMLSTTVSDLNLRFASSEYSTVSVRPELEVTFTTPTPPNPPTATVTSPPSTATSSPITVSGSASATAPATLTQVTWANAASGTNGTATGTSSWTATIPLVIGSNAITITATDSTGATGSTSFTVLYTPPPRTSAKADKTYCGMGAAEGSSGGWSVALGLLLALLVAAGTRKG